MPVRLCQKVSSFVVGNIERAFYRHGESVGRHPWRYIGLVLAFVCLASLGFLRFRQEKHPMRLWIPQESDFAHDTNWLMEEYGEGFRTQSVLVTAPDVLQPEILQQVLSIHLDLHNISGEGTTWTDVCFKVPIISFNIDNDRSRRQISRNASDPFDFGSSFDSDVFSSKKSQDEVRNMQQLMNDESFDPSVYLGSALYCSIVRNMQYGCLQRNVLDLWKYDPARVGRLTKNEILHTINTTIISPVLGHQMDYVGLLGGVTYDESGAIVSAKALLSVWMVHINFSTVNMDEVGNHGGTADWANGPGLEWETKFLDVMQKRAGEAKGMKVYYEAGRSFGDISSAGMFQDLDKLFLGIVLMLIYIQMQQTRKSWVKARVTPGYVGLLAIGFAFISSCGVCSMMGIAYGPVHTSLPFLLLGIGVDDMFVILSCWNNLPEEERQASLPRRMGMTMRHAGLSITITSATDAVAFAIGSTTILPSLQSFCIYAAVGVILTYFMQASLFVSALALDQRRIEAKRNCLLPCIVHTCTALPSVDKTSNYCNTALKAIFTKAIFTFVGKILVLLTSLSLLGVGVWGTVGLRQEFDPEWFLDQNSYLLKFLQQRREYFPDLGNTASVYLGRLNYSAELQNIGRLVDKLHNETTILKDLDDWWHSFQRYVSIHYRKDITSQSLTEEDFQLYISKYLHSPSGSRYQKNFRFAEPLVCGKPAPAITVAGFDFIFKPFSGPGEHVPAMNRVKQLVRDANFTTGDRFGTVWGKVFANWVTDEVIAAELYRNILLALMCVGGTTLILLADFSMSCWVLLCVLLTLVDVGGLMCFWGLTIDLVSCIALVLAVGLCVDFAAHVGYAFLGSHGTKEQRALNAVTYIGGAVLHGGATTLLALSVLVFSSSYIFKAFFKIFLLVIFLGLFHGLVLLPVILSLVGPPPYSLDTSKDSYRQKRKTRMDLDQEQECVYTLQPPAPASVEGAELSPQSALCSDHDPRSSASNA